jgi:hypothetical protein
MAPMKTWPAVLGALVLLAAYLAAGPAEGYEASHPDTGPTASSPAPGIQPGGYMKMPVFSDEPSQDMTDQNVSARKDTLAP